MQKKKAAVQSVGFIGSVTGIIGFLGLIPELIGLIQTLQPEIQEIINQGAVLFGLILALVGRLRASSVITGIFRA